MRFRDDRERDHVVRAAEATADRVDLTWGPGASWAIRALVEHVKAPEAAPLEPGVPLIGGPRDGHRVAPSFTGRVLIVPVYREPSILPIPQEQREHYARVEQHQYHRESLRHGNGPVACDVLRHESLSPEEFLRWLVAGYRRGVPSDGQ